MQDIQVGARTLKREKQSDVIAGFKDKRRPLAKEWGEPLESGKGKGQIFLEPPEGIQPYRYFNISPMRLLPSSTVRQ